MSIIRDIEEITTVDARRETANRWIYFRPIGTPNSRLASERLVLALDNRLEENSISTLTPYGYKILHST
jgi:hypothetical protein